MRTLNEDLKNPFRNYERGQEAYTKLHSRDLVAQRKVKASSNILSQIVSFVFMLVGWILGFMRTAAPDEQIDITDVMIERRRVLAELVSTRLLLAYVPPAPTP